MRRGTHRRWFASVPPVLLLLASTTALVGLNASPAGAIGGTTFTYTGGEQTYTVPAGVTSVTITAVGAPGGSSQDGVAGGDGASVTATVPVTPGQTLYVEVGGSGANGPCAGGDTGSAFNGGGSSPCGGGGGGASDVRTCSMSTCTNLTPDTRQVVAGGGGGGGYTGGSGGQGGDSTVTGAGNGGNGCDGCNGAAGGLGGTGPPAGTGGNGTTLFPCNGGPGTLGQGGSASYACDHINYGGGGGGGYDGGGAGGDGNYGGGGGGAGSSYWEPSATGTSMSEDTTGTPLVTITPGPSAQGSEIHDVVQVETNPSYAGDPVEISSSQLDSSCTGAVVYDTLQKGSTVGPTMAFGSISVVLDNEGNATVVVSAAECAPGTDLIEADLTVAPYLSSTVPLVVKPPTTWTTAGVAAYPSTEVETGDSPTSGDSDVYTVFYVETSPVYAEQPVEISSTQLEDRCGGGWLWEPADGTPINQTSGTAVAITTLDDNGNAVFVFKGASCAPGTSVVTADVLAGTHPTYTSTFTVAPPAVTLSPATGTTRATKATRRHHHKGSGSGGGDPPMVMTASPNPLIETGGPTQQCPPTWPTSILLQQGCVAYVVTSSAPSVLDLEFIRGPDVGQVIVIGPVTGTVGGDSLTDIAMSASGTLYGSDYSDLYTINPTTGAATLVGPTGTSDLNGLVVGPTGTIYGSGYIDDDLYTIDPTTGAATVVGPTSFSSSGDLAFADNGTLYMTALDGPTDGLVAVNPSTGAGTLVGAIGHSHVYGLASSYGTLFGATEGGDLLTINPTTGAGTVIATGGPSANGMASPPNQT
jgi:hypothetical protein